MFLLTMTGLACFYSFTVSVTSQARNRVHAAVDPVTTQIVSPVGHAPVGTRLIFQGGFEFNPDTVTFVTITRLMAHGAYLMMSIGDGAMIF
jgi:hypothetical protein